MIKTSEYFWIKKDPDAPSITNAAGFTRSKYPYFTDAVSFSKVDDEVAYYEYKGIVTHCDILFEPTFLINDRLQSLFTFLEPEIKFKGVQLYQFDNRENSSKPLYWLPYLPYVEAIHEATEVIQGKPKRLILKRENLSDSRVIHCKLPAADIWILSLEAAECLLRRQPVGIILEKIYDIR